MLRQHPRIAVVGTSCSGKTTLARRLASLFNRRHIELDALHWGPEWTTRPDFVLRAEAALAGSEWVSDGNYRVVRDLILRRATAVVWLDYPFPLVFWRALRRTVGRLRSGEILYAQNVETFRGSFLQRDGIPWWVVRTHCRRRREYGVLFADPRYAHLEVFEMKSPAQTDRLVEREGRGSAPA
jgi:adenylate kinase family enzyme